MKVPSVAIQACVVEGTACPSELQDYILETTYIHTCDAPLKSELCIPFCDQYEIPLNFWTSPLSSL